MIDLGIESIDVFFWRSRDFCESAFKFELKELRQQNTVELIPSMFWSTYILYVYKPTAESKGGQAKIQAIMKVLGPWEGEYAREDKERQLIKNNAKYKGVEKIRTEMKTLGWEIFRKTYISEPEFLKKLPFIGPSSYLNLYQALNELSTHEEALDSVASFFKFDKIESLVRYLSTEYGESQSSVRFILYKGFKEKIATPKKS